PPRAPRQNLHLLGGDQLLLALPVTKPGRRIVEALHAPWESTLHATRNLNDFGASSSPHRPEIGERPVLRWATVAASRWTICSPCGPASRPTSRARPAPPSR